MKVYQLRARRAGALGRQARLRAGQSARQHAAPPAARQLGKGLPARGADEGRGLGGGRGGRGWGGRAGGALTQLVRGGAGRYPPVQARLEHAPDLRRDEPLGDAISHDRKLMEVISRFSAMPPTVCKT